MKNWRAATGCLKFGLKCLGSDGPARIEYSKGVSKTFDCLNELSQVHYLARHRVKSLCNRLKAVRCERGLAEISYQRECSFCLVLDNV